MNTHNTSKYPTWWTKENDSSWDRVKAAMKRDWDQTKHDFGGQQPDTNQKIGNTVRQAEGKEAIPPRQKSTYDSSVEPQPPVSVTARAPNMASCTRNGMTSWKPS